MDQFLNEQRSGLRNNFSQHLELIIKNDKNSIE